MNRRVMDMRDRPRMVDSGRGNRRCQAIGLGSCMNLAFIALVMMRDDTGFCRQGRRRLLDDYLFLDDDDFLFFTGKVLASGRRGGNLSLRSSHNLGLLDEIGLLLLRAIAVIRHKLPLSLLLVLVLKAQLDTAGGAMTHLGSHACPAIRALVFIFGCVLFFDAFFLLAMLLLVTLWWGFFG